MPSDNVPIYFELDLATSKITVYSANLQQPRFRWFPWKLSHLQKQPPEVFSKKSLRPAALLKKEALTLLFSSKFCKIFKNTFFAEHLWMTASEFGRKS